MALIISLGTTTFAAYTQKQLDAFGNGGYQTTSYEEVVEIVPDLPEGMTKDTVKLTDVITGAITLEQFVACLSADEMAMLAGDKERK